MSPTPEVAPVAASMSVNIAAAAGADRLVPPIGNGCGCFLHVGGTDVATAGWHFVSYGSGVNVSKPVAGSPLTAMSGTSRRRLLPKLPFSPVGVTNRSCPMPAAWYAGRRKIRDSPPPEPPVSLGCMPWQISGEVQVQPESAQLWPLF